MSDDKAPSDYVKWKHEQDRAVAERAHDAESEFANKVNEAAVTAGNHAIRALILINGGAAVAILAFIGHLAGGKEGRLGDKLPELTAPLIWFVWGVALATAGAALAYCTNYCIGTSSTKRDRFYEHPFIRQSTASKWWARCAALFHVFAILASVGSLVMFLMGMTEIRAAIGSLR